MEEAVFMSTIQLRSKFRSKRDLYSMMRNQSKADSCITSVTSALLLAIIQKMTNQIYERCIGWEKDGKAHIPFDLH